MTVSLPHQEVKCTPPFPRNWVGLGDYLDQLEVSEDATLWLLRIAYKNVTHFLHGALALGNQTSWCEEVQETHGEASQGEGLRTVAHSAGVAPANSRHQLASTRVVKVDDPAAGDLLQLMPHGVAKSHPHWSPDQMTVHEQNKWLLLL